MKQGHQHLQQTCRIGQNSKKESRAIWGRHVGPEGTSFPCGFKNLHTHTYFFLQPPPPPGTKRYPRSAQETFSNVRVNGFVQRQPLLRNVWGLAKHFSVL